MDDREGPPWVPVPERLDRRLRLGPFASGRELLLFLTAAAAGAVVGFALAPWAGLAIAGAGTVLATWRPRGEPLDRTAAALAGWGWRRLGGGRRVTTPLPAGAGALSYVTLEDGRRATIVRAGGVPLAYLPPAELARQFEGYRTLLRALDGALVLLATSAPIFAAAVRPPDTERLGAEETAARNGYGELVRLLARRRTLRRVYLAVVQEGVGPAGARRLETATDLLVARLAELGVPAERLRQRPLGEAARRLGLLGAGESIG